MANNYSTQDLVKRTLVACGERTDGTSNYHNLALNFVNDVYKNILSGANEFAPELGDAWTWARQTASLILPGYYGTGSVNMVLNSINATFTSTPTTSLAGYHLKCTNIDTWYQIVTHTAGAAAFTIDAPWVDASGAFPFVAPKLVVDLGSGILRLVEPFRIYSDRVLEYHENSNDMSRIYALSVLDFWKKFPLRQIINDIPSVFMTLTRSESSWKIQFNKYVTNQIRVDYDYIAIPTELTDSSTSIPLVPFEYRDFLWTGAAFYLSQTQNNDAKAQEFYKLTAAKIQAMHLAEEKYLKLGSVGFAQLTPRLDDTAIPVWLIQR